jgi:hypothetical protein
MDIDTRKGYGRKEKNLDGFIIRRLYLMKTWFCIYLIIMNLETGYVDLGWFNLVKLGDIG